MLRANTWLLRLLAMVMGSAPRIADTLGGNPRLLRAVLEPGFFLPIPGREQLAGELQERLEGEEERIGPVAGWAGDRRFQVGVQSLENLISPDEASASLSHVAEVVVEVLFRDVLAELEEHHGSPGGGCAVVAMGKLGAEEMTFESDLDLLLVADVADGRETTAGPAPIEARRFYGRAAQRLIAALRSRSASGRLYEVDMRLRPSGESGPLVTSLEAFREYQAGAAWTWEHMSLTRARVLCGDEATAEAAGREIRQVLTRPRDPAALLRDVAGMRCRIAAEYPPGDPFELKYARGGLVDLEFTAQYLQLLHAHDRPEVLAGGTAACFEALSGAGLLDEGGGPLPRRRGAHAARPSGPGAAHLERGDPGARRPRTAAPEAGGRPGVHRLRRAGRPAPRHPGEGLRPLPGAHRPARGEGLTPGFNGRAGAVRLGIGPEAGLHTKKAGTGPERIRPVPAKWVLPAGWESLA